MPSVFGCFPPGSRYGRVPNELIHRAGPPFLDNHYRGYQYYMSNGVHSAVGLVSEGFVVRLAKALNVV